MTLHELQKGQIAYVLKIRGRGAFRKRMMEMGFTHGRKVEVVRKAPFSDPIDYSLMGYEVSLRRMEARMIEVVTLEELQKEQSNECVALNEDVISAVVKKLGREINVALVGNPNCGKTTIFNFVSGASEHVGNYSGVTVDAKDGSFEYKSYKFKIVDLPGTYSLSAYTPEELYVRKHLLGESPDIVLNVIDSSNLERNLFLTTQLLELDIPIVVALNIYDELEAKGDKFDYDSLGKMLGIPFVPTVGYKRKGISELLDNIISVYEMHETSRRRAYIRFPNEFEESVELIRKFIEEKEFVKESISARFYAIKLLEKDKEAMQMASEKEFADVKLFVEKEIERVESFYKNDTESIVADSRYGFISGALKETYEPGAKVGKTTKSQRIDAVLTHKFFGIPLFLLFLWLMFYSTFSLGSYPMEWLESGVGFLGNWVSNFMSDGAFKDLLVNGIINGVGGVLVFLPNILLLFLFIAFMEDTGYMARVAFLMDKFMHKIGLHGKSFIPLIMGFGCNVPAIMATRTLENRSDRLLTILINPFMSCSARLPVYILFISAFFPENPVIVLFSVYFIGIVVAVLMALLFKSTLFRKSEAPFVMELPPYRMPSGRTVAKHVWFRASQYLKKMGSVILVASVIIWALGYFPRNTEEKVLVDKQVAAIDDDISRVNKISPDSVASLEMRKDSILSQFEVDRQQNSYVGKIGAFIQPVMEPLGFDWRLSVSLVSGIAAKEIVVSTLSVLFGSVDTDDVGSDEVGERISAAKYQSGKKAGEPLLNKITAFAFLMFVLLYFPCIATVTAIGREAGGWKWSLFTMVYTCAIAWLVAFGVQQIGVLFI